MEVPPEKGIVCQHVSGIQLDRKKPDLDGTGG